MPQNTEEKRRNHALSNEKVCNYLNESGKFPDWVITTAFYSALQFVKYKAFPLKLDAETFNSFDDYYIHEKHNNQYGGKSPHEVIKRLVNRHLKKIAAPYHELYDACHNARYSDYEINDDDVKIALENLAEIKKFCNTEKPKHKVERQKMTTSRKKN